MSLAPFDRAFARYFTMTHLYNAGESGGILQEYRKALYKLVNSLSWGVDSHQPYNPSTPKELSSTSTSDTMNGIGMIAGRR